MGVFVLAQPTCANLTPSPGPLQPCVTSTFCSDAPGLGFLPPPHDRAWCKPASHYPSPTLPNVSWRKANLERRIFCHTLALISAPTFSALHSSVPEPNRNMVRERENQANKKDQLCGVAGKLDSIFFRVVKTDIFSLYNEEIQIFKNWKREKGECITTAPLSQLHQPCKLHLDSFLSWKRTSPCSAQLVFHFFPESLDILHFWGKHGHIWRLLCTVKNPSLR